MSEQLKKLNYLYKLKEVYRHSTLKGRTESSAEHSWSVMMLAEYFLIKKGFVEKYNIDKLKVFRLLLYHDLIEIEAGDTPLYGPDREKKDKKETLILPRLLEEMPEAIAKEQILLFQEFGELKTVEAKFAKAIDKLDPLVHAAHIKTDWKAVKATEQVLRDKHQKYLVPFPELMKLFEEIIKHAKEMEFITE